MSSTEITALTPCQSEQLNAFYEEWLAIGRSTQPLDCVEVERAVVWMYEYLGKKRPLIWYCQSPWQMCVTPPLLNKLTDTGERVSALDSQLDGRLGSRLRGQLYSQLGSQLGSQLRGQLYQLRSQLDGRLGNQLGGQLGGQLRRQLDGRLGNQLGGQLRGQLRSDAKTVFDNARFFPAWWWHWYTYAEFPAQYIEKFTLKSGLRETLASVQHMRRSIYACAMFDNICFVCERPTRLAVDEQGRFHDETGPSLEFSDGYTLHSWHGVSVEADVIERPETITIDRISTEANAEVRRVLIERYGQARYLSDSGAEKVSEDDYGVLYRKELPGDPEPLVMVKVVNSTPEPDGTFKDYFLRVPPGIKTAREAVGWTFGFESANTYAPAVET